MVTGKGDLGIELPFQRELRFFVIVLRPGWQCGTKEKNGNNRYGEYLCFHMQ
jgi:hypothetical protein